MVVVVCVLFVFVCVVFADAADAADAADVADVTAVAAPAPKPFFIFWAPRIVHSPLQVPHKELNYFSFINNTARAYYHAMVYYIDEAIGNVTQELKSSGQWDNTLMVSDVMRFVCKVCDGMGVFFGFIFRKTAHDRKRWHLLESA